MTSRFEAGTAAAVPDLVPAVGDPDGITAADGSEAVGHRVHRLADLSSRHRCYALALALALLVAPVSSAVRMMGRWTPAGDNALIELRARDVGSARTPLIGQPSSSSQYGARRQFVAHPGPVEFYLLAPAVRLLGGRVGMLLTAAMITGLSVLVAAWAVFRQLGPGGGLVAAASLAAVMWTVGSAAMVNPISSVVGGFPLLCSAVLLWCLVCGDVRLLAITCVVVSFTAQQHLSVVPATVVITVSGALGLVVTLARRGMLRDRVGRRELSRSAIVAAGLGFVLWAPVLFQQLFRPPGNLRILIRYAGDQSRDDVGYGSAFRQVAHTLGVPPLLGRTNLVGYDLHGPLRTVTLVSALLAAALLMAAAISWRRRAPRLSALVAMTGALALGGLLNGAGVPDSLEQSRIAFYHWAFVLAFFELVVLLMAAAALVRRWGPGKPVIRRLMITGVVVPFTFAAILAPAVGNLVVSRRENTIPLLVPKSTTDDIDAGVRSHRDEITRPTLLLQRGGNVFLGLFEAVAARLDAAGIKVVLGPDQAGFVDRRRLVDYRTVRSGIVIVFGRGEPAPGVPGKLIASANPAPDFDRDAFGFLVRQARSGRQIVPDPALERLLERPPTTAERRLLLDRLPLLRAKPASVLAQRSLLRLLADNPRLEPALDRRMISRVLATFPEVQGGSITATHISVYLLDRPQLLQYAPPPQSRRR